MKKVVLVVGALLLMGCDSKEKDALKQQVQALQAQNAALTSERDALKAERDLLKTQMRQFEGAMSEARRQANKSAATSYARNCVTSIEVIKVDRPDGTTPPEINGKSCDDSSIFGEAASTKPSMIASSRIVLDEYGENYEVQVTTTDGQTASVKYP